MIDALKTLSNAIAYLHRDVPVYPGRLEAIDLLQRAYGRIVDGK